MAVSGMDDIGARTLAKVRRRLLPFMGLLFLVNYLDRVNVSFAALSMNADLGFTPAVYGFGAGVFFLGYFLFEVPSNLALHRFGARLWIARIMLTWGVIATAMALVSGPVSFYVLRFLLGAAEAGFYPGMILYITYWFPQRHRIQAIALFALASPLASIIGAPLSTAILDIPALQGLAGLKSWQWLYIVEGIPALVLGVVVLRRLTDRPADAAWLQDDERAWLTREMAAEARAVEATHRMSIGQTLRDSRVLTACAGFVFNVIALYGLTLWLPLIIRGFGGLSKFEVGLVSAIPFIVAATCSVLNGRHSDRTGERKFHLLIPALIGAAGFAAAASIGNPVLAFVALCIGQAGLWASNNMLWSVAASFLTGSTAAAGIGLINATGNLGGFVGPYAVGYVREQTGSFALPMYGLAAAVLAYGVILFGLARRLEREDVLHVSAAARTVTP